MIQGYQYISPVTRSHISILSIVLFMFSNVLLPVLAGRKSLDVKQVGPIGALKIKDK